MSHDVVDENGNKYAKGWDGQYHGEQGAFGPKRATNILGSPKIDHDLLGDRKAERDMLGGQRTSAAGQPLYQSGGSGGGFDNPLVGLGLLCVVIAVIVTCGIFLIPFGIGRWISKRAGRPWSTVSIATIISAFAIGCLSLAWNSNNFAHGTVSDADIASTVQGYHMAGLSLWVLGGVMLTLKFKEAARIDNKGYDDSPWTVRYLWSWIIALGPLAVGLVGLADIYGTVTGAWGTAPGKAGGDLLLTAACFLIALGGWMWGQRLRRAIIAERDAVERGQYARYA